MFFHAIQSLIMNRKYFRKLFAVILLYMACFPSYRLCAERPDLSGIYKDPKAAQYYLDYNKQIRAQLEQQLNDARQKHQKEGESASADLMLHIQNLEERLKRPDFFTFASLNDLPKDLKWQDGSTEEEFASPKAKRGGTLNYWVPSWPPTLRFVGPNANSMFRGYILDYNQMSLVQIHPNTDRYIPGIASSWAVGNDHRTVYYRIDPDARFADGQPISADDFFFLFYFMHSEWIVAPWYNNFYKEEFANITKYDDYTISVTIATPKPDPVYWSTVEPLPRNFYREFGPDFVQRYQQRCQPTSGPYTILPQDVKTDESITLSRAKEWWGDNKKYMRYRFNPDRIVFRVIRDGNKAYKIFLKGDIDNFLMILPKYWYECSKTPEFKNGYLCKATFYNDIPRPSYGVYINTAKPGLSDLNVRLGIQHSMDFDSVIQIFYRGDYYRLNSYNEGFGKYSDHSIRARKFDPEKAREYFTKAGYTEQGSDGILKKADGTRLMFKLLARDIGDVPKWMPLIVDSAWKCGMEIVPELLDTTTTYRKVQEKQHDMVYTAWQLTGRYPRYWEGFHGINAYNPDGSIKTQTNNIFSYNSPIANQLIDRYDRAQTEEELVTLSHQLLETIHDDAIYVPGACYGFYRYGYWRWIKFPEWFDVKSNDDPMYSSLFWIDEDAKKETLEAMKSGKKFPVVNETYEQFRQD